MSVLKARSSNRKKRIFISFMATLFILAGTTLAAYPYLQTFYYDVIKSPEPVEVNMADQPDIQEDEITADASIKAEIEPVSEENFPRGESSSNSSSSQSTTSTSIANTATASTYGGTGDLPAGTTGVLEIPALNLRLNVLYGVSEGVLKQGIGFYPQSGSPDTGNVCIAGHRNAYGSPFWHLDKLMPGDSIILYVDNQAYSYEIALDWSIISPTDQPAITLTTCDPKIRPPDGKYNRLIIRGYLNTYPLF